MLVGILYAHAIRLFDLSRNVLLAAFEFRASGRVRELVSIIRAAFDNKKIDIFHKYSNAPLALTRKIFIEIDTSDYRLL